MTTVWEIQQSKYNSQISKHMDSSSCCILKSSLYMKRWGERDPTFPHNQHLLWTFRVSQNRKKKTSSETRFLVLGVERRTTQRILFSFLKLRYSGISKLRKDCFVFMHTQKIARCSAFLRETAPPMSPVQVENALLSHLTYASQFQSQSIRQHADRPSCGPVASWTGAMASCTAYNQEKIYWWISLLSQQIRNQTIISHGQATYGEKQIKMEHGGPGQMVQKSKAIIALPEVPGSVLNTQVAAQSHL